MELTQEAWKDELEAQIEEHGAQDLALYLDNTDERQPLYITDVSYQDGELRVKVSI